MADLSFLDDELNQLKEQGLFNVIRTIAGSMTLHNELEEKLAKFKGVEAAISFQSGFNVNTATVSAR